MVKAIKILYKSTIKKLLLLLIIPFLNFGQTPCLDAVANATGLIGEFIPQCEDDGSYSPIQCWWSTGYCWCVDENGVEIPGTAIQTWLGEPDCSSIETCDPLYDCGPPLGMPNYLCNDSLTVAGPGNCVMNENGECVWEIIYCPEEIGCSDPKACNYNPDAIPGNFDDNSCLYSEDSCILIVEDYCSCCSGPCDGLCPYELLDSLYGENWFCFYDVPDLSYQEGQILVSGFINENCECITNEIIGVISGCTDPYACNYDSTATVDDGLCIYQGGECIVAVGINGEIIYGIWNVDCSECVYDNTAITEFSSYKKNIKVIDVLGRETTNKGFQLHIYDDGSVEKKYVIK